MQRTHTTKTICTISVLTVMLALQQCAGKKEVPFTYPKVVTAEMRPAFDEQFQRGHALYEINCSGCHTQVVNGKKVIPDFTRDQLIGYMLRMRYPSHRKPLHETFISRQELMDVELFLKHRKPSGCSMTTPPKP